MNTITQNSTGGWDYIIYTCPICGLPMSGIAGATCQCKTAIHIPSVFGLDSSIVSEQIAASPVKLFRLGSITTIRGPWFSLGVHVDFQHRYVDIHFIWWIISIGNANTDWEAVPEFE